MAYRSESECLREELKNALAELEELKKKQDTERPMILYTYSNGEARPLAFSILVSSGILALACGFCYFQFGKDPELRALSLFFAFVFAWISRKILRCE